MSGKLQMPWRAALETAVQRLADAPEHHNALRVFVDHFGLEGYRPPEHVEETVRNAIAGLLACACALTEDRNAKGESHE